MITVPEVMRDLGLQWRNEDAWTIGAAVRERYRELHGGKYPEKKLRPKTSGCGSHCFAVYPLSFRKEIERIISMHETAKSAQRSLF